MGLDTTMRSKLTSLVVAAAFALPLVSGVAFAQGTTTPSTNAPAINAPVTNAPVTTQAAPTDKKVDAVKSKKHVARTHKTTKDQHSTANGTAATKSQSAKAPEAAKTPDAAAPAKKL